MSDFPAFQKWANPDGTLTLEALRWLRDSVADVAHFVRVDDESDIPEPPAPQTFYYEVA